MTSFGLLAVLNVGFKNVGARYAVPEPAERRAPCSGEPLTHFVSPPREKRGLTLRVIVIGNPLSSVQDPGLSSGLARA